MAGLVQDVTAKVVPVLGFSLEVATHGCPEPDLA